MSQENVDIVRKTLAAYEQRDLAALRTLNDPDVVLDWSASRGWLAGVYRGLESAMAFMTDYFNNWEGIVIETERYIPVGDSVVVPNMARQRGRDGVEVTARSTFVFTVRDRKVTRLCLYQEQDEALKAAGLEE